MNKIDPVKTKSSGPWTTKNPLFDKVSIDRPVVEDTVWCCVTCYHRGRDRGTGLLREATVQLSSPAGSQLQQHVVQCSAVNWGSRPLHWPIVKLCSVQDRWQPHCQRPAFLLLYLECVQNHQYPHTERPYSFNQQSKIFFLHFLAQSRTEIP